MKPETIYSVLVKDYKLTHRGWLIPIDRRVLVGEEAKPTGSFTLHDDGHMEIEVEHVMLAKEAVAHPQWAFWRDNFRYVRKVVRVFYHESRFTWVTTLKCEDSELGGVS